jgi:hypothetical protein
VFTRRLFCSLLALAVIAWALPAQAADDDGFTPLFNGKDLTGWKPVLQKKDADPNNTWSVKDNILTCKGQPAGYIRTEKEYENYILKLEWRYTRPADLKDDKEFKGNNGVLVHMHGEDKVWPASIEVQGMNRAAGSIFAVAPVVGPRKMQEHKARPVGEWNSFVITCRDGQIECVLNGEHTTSAGGYHPTKDEMDKIVRKGYILLQSEGAEIHFRNIMIKELK